jgi:hypothetical protein
MKILANSFPPHAVPVEEVGPVRQVIDKRDGYPGLLEVSRQQKADGARSYDRDVHGFHIRCFHNKKQEDFRSPYKLPIPINITKTIVENEGIGEMKRRYGDDLLEILFL